VENHFVNKNWVIKKHDHERVAAFAAELGVKPIVAALLISRGHDCSESAGRFLNPCAEHLHDPSLLKGMADAVTRIETALNNGEKILIWGDYDVDGTTGTVLLRKALHLLGSETGFHVPNRFTEGYGINIPALEKAKADGYSLVISVDCGIRSFEPLEWAAANGLDVIVTDHHLSDEVRGNPPAVAVVNPNQPGCPYPDKELAGVGVAFKLAHALLRGRGMEHEVPQFLKIAAIGTVADVMKLSGENRAIVALGLEDLGRTQNVGLRALMDAADCRDDMTSYHIGFRIGPRINAAGRMDIARHVVDLLEENSVDKARELATILNGRNRERQEMQERITQLALSETELHDGRHFVVVAGDGWHQGVIGLAASRIAEKLYRPTIVLSVIDGVGHGSARSVPGFHLLDALDTCEDILIQYGGHAAAAGMKVDLARIPELRERLNSYAASTLTGDDLVPQLNIDAAITPATLNLGLVDDLKILEPFGAANPKPIFVTKGLTVKFDPTVMKDKHLKLKLASDDGRGFEAVWWDGVARSKGRTLERDSRIQIAYTPEANEWLGNRRLQLVVEDLRADN
jgi:single-stranded-DNA-specific exonuclease